MRDLRLLSLSLFAMFTFSSAVCNAADIKKFKNNKHSEINIEKEKSGKNVNLKFVVKIPSGIKYNWDGPWKLKLTGSNVAVKLGTSDFDKKLGAFKVSVPAGSGDLNYRLTAFVCTEDKTRCYRDAHKGNVKI